ncbi:MAG: hypothetical protein LBB09_02305 [Rickettsiales bacterium]|jgi:hypothetical protein|nr:hypothetical protein [Rickettsiales bacterium]
MLKSKYQNKTQPRIKSKSYAEIAGKLDLLIVSFEQLDQFLEEKKLEEVLEKTKMDAEPEHFDLTRDLDAKLKLL